MSDKVLSSNVPELSVSEISQALKATVEQSFSHVRVRGELSRITIANSGHIYADLKDDKALINTICWRGSMHKLSVRPEEGLEVICTGRLSTYPGRSNYQLIIEGMELAGEGALLKMLEQRRKKLASEGLFDEARKKPLPFLPQTIGVVTSPTGAVIRDILHRLEDRFPRHVLVWPVRVQGEQAAEEVTKAIHGFNAFRDDDPKLPRPDLIIVARGGGSLEDLMPFNEENIVRAVAASTIPVISSVGHETDTTLIDLAADRRAPTPTAAAEMAVPRRDELIAGLLESQTRLLNALRKKISYEGSQLNGVSRGLLHPARMLENKWQAFDHISQNLNTRFETHLMRKKETLRDISSRLRHPKDVMEQAAQKLNFASQNLERVSDGLLEAPKQKLESQSRLLETLSFKRVLDRGFALVRDENGVPVMDPNALKTSQKISLQFKEDITKKAEIKG